MTTRDPVTRAKHAEAGLELARRDHAARQAAWEVALGQMQTAVTQARAATERVRSELRAYHAAAESTDLEGDVRDHLADLAEWETEDRSAPDWLVDAVIGLIAPVKAERDRATGQERRVREVIAWLRGCDDELTPVADRLDAALDGGEGR